MKINCIIAVLNLQDTEDKFVCMTKKTKSSVFSVVGCEYLMLFLITIGTVYALFGIIFFQTCG